VDLGTWGWSTRPRPLAPDVELVLLVDCGGRRAVDRPTQLQSLGLLLELHRRDWRVGGVPTREQLQAGAR
jgi:hypothetical protein